MSTTTDFAVAARFTSEAIFRRVLVGIDDSPESLEAARQAGTLAVDRVTLLAAYDRPRAIAEGGRVPGLVRYDEGSARERAQKGLEQAKRELGSITTVGKSARGRAWEELIYEIARRNNTLVAVGSHGAGRAKGILIGSTATELVHKAPCSVLAARKPRNEFPSSIVVGVVNSLDGAAADVVARDLAARFDAQLERLENLARPVSSLVAAAAEADLIVVGSRGLHGVKALGSVSERVAHEARCSVLIVR